MTRVRLRGQPTYLLALNIVPSDNAPVPVPTTYDWTVSPLNPADRNYLTAPIHFLLWTGFGESSFNSKYIHIKPISVDRATSSSSSSQPSSSAATAISVRTRLGNPPFRCPLVLTWLVLVRIISNINRRKLSF